MLRSLGFKTKIKNTKKELIFFDETGERQDDLALIGGGGSGILHSQTAGNARGLIPEIVAAAAINIYSIYKYILHNSRSATPRVRAVRLMLPS